MIGARELTELAHGNNPKPGCKGFGPTVSAGSFGVTFGLERNSLPETGCHFSATWLCSQMRTMEESCPCSVMDIAFAS